MTPRSYIWVPCPEDGCDWEAQMTGGDSDEVGEFLERLIAEHLMTVHGKKGDNVFTRLAEGRV